MRPNLLIIALIALFQFSAITNSAQDIWEFNRKRQKRSSIPFRLINNLIIVKLKINQSNSLNFIVDTGVKSTLITELSQGDSLTLNDAKEFKLKGLGGDGEIKALRTSRNTIKIGSLTGKEQDVLVLLDNVFHLSEKLGLKIHGIIGYELFKDHVVLIDYATKRLIIYRHGKYKHKKKFKTFPLSWHRYKPYMNINVMMPDTSEIIPMHMLIDTGSSDAIWIFKQSASAIQIPKHNIRTYLGHGLSGEVYGHKARVNVVRFGKFELFNPIASFPDSSDLSIALNYKLRNGSIGGEILKRFKVVFDYKSSTISIKPNHSFKQPFHFNLSGIELSTPYPGVPIFLIADVRQNSPAQIAGLKPGDQIISINYRPITDFKLQEIQGIFSKNRNRYVNIRITREGKNKSFRFKLTGVL